MDDLELRVDLGVLRSIGSVLRAADFKVTAVIVDDVLIDVQPGDTTARLYGIAFDLGTTTVVATLLDLTTGTPLAVASMLNKQQPFGADVITRISAIMMEPTALGTLARLAHETLAELTTDVCTQAGVDPAEVVRGGAGRQRDHDAHRARHRPGAAGVAPFIMAARQLPEVLAADLGLPVHPRARAFLFPAFGAYVGGDITAGLIASGMDRDSRDPAVRRHRHELRDRARQPGLAAGHRGPGRPGLRGRGDQVRDARGRRRDRGRLDDAGRPGRCR